MFVACSTMCFGQQSLTEALQSIGELGFSKVDLVVREDGPHLRPSEVAGDLNRAVQMLRSAGGLGVAALHVDLPVELPRATAIERMKSFCRLARVLTTPLISVPAAAADSSLAGEIDRFSSLNRIAQSDGVTLAIETRLGTLSDDPANIVALCQAVPGLGVALDPSPYLVGPLQSQNLDELFPYVQHVRLRDTSGRLNQFQVRIGQGEIEYGRIVSQLARHNYQRTLSVDLHDAPDVPFPVQPEVRKLKYLLESLI